MSFDDVLKVREAAMADLPAVLVLLADITVSKEPVQYADEIISDPPLESYSKAFAEIISLNKWRDDAIGFYEKLGFTRSHEGFRIQF